MRPVIIGMSEEDFGENAPDYINGVPVIYDPVNYGVVIIKAKNQQTEIIDKNAMCLRRGDNE